MGTQLGGVARPSLFSNGVPPPRSGTGVGVAGFAFVLSPAAFQDILKWRRCSCDAPEFIELFYDTRGLLGLPIRV